MRIRTLIWTIGALGASALAVEGQGLSDYDYEELSFRGVGFDVGYIRPDQVRSTETWGMRLDLGYLGPGVRILPRAGYWSTRMKNSEVAGLERRVAALVGDQNPLAPPLEVDLGVIEWSAISVGADAQLVWRVPMDILTYAGVGVAAHFQNGSGSAIDGTFVEDLLDSTVAGANLHAGLEFPLARRIRLYGDARLEVAGDVQFWGLRTGLQFMFQDPAPGEVRGS